MRSVNLAIMVVLISAPSACDSPAAEGICGNNICEEDETATSCPADCGCSNGVQNAGESCDGTDLGGATCESEGRGTGDLGCTGDCTFDYAGCSSPEICGNGTKGGSEDCDGNDLGGVTCEELNFAGGTLGCTANCTFNEALRLLVQSIN